MRQGNVIHDEERVKKLLDMINRYCYVYSVSIRDTLYKYHKNLFYQRAMVLVKQGKIRRYHLDRKLVLVSKSAPLPDSSNDNLLHNLRGYLAVLDFALRTKIEFSIPKPDEILLHPEKWKVIKDGIKYNVIWDPGYMSIEKIKDAISMLKNRNKVLILTAQDVKTRKLKSVFAGNDNVWVATQIFPREVVINE